MAEDGGAPDRRRYVKRAFTLDAETDRMLSELYGDYALRPPGKGLRSRSRSRIVRDAITALWRYRMAGESLINPGDPRFH